MVDIKGWKMKLDKNSRKKPDFIRQDAHKKPGLSRNWRRPKGWQNKVRLGIRGYRKRPSTGYGAPSDLKCLDSHGRRIVVVRTLADLDALTKNDVIVLSSTTGMKKKTLLITEIKKRGLAIYDADADALLNKFAQVLAEKKKASSEKVKRKADRKKSSEDKAAKKKDAELTDKEKKDQEKKEKDKVLLTKE